MTPPAVQHIGNHVLHYLSGHSQKPLFVAIQGPQGSGKSFLTRLVQTYLSNDHGLRIASVSIDDLYLPHEGLVNLTRTHPRNPLWRGRGQPGTHDIALGKELLESLKCGNKAVEIPRFDKSLFNGEGDRLPLDGSGVIVEPPVDVVIMEGWCVGFHPISQEELGKRCDGVWKDVKAGLNLDETIVGTKGNIEEVNKTLFAYSDLWSFFDVFIQLQPKSSGTPYSVVYKWRLEQEHYMKASNGGKGMTDSAVKLFVDRYIPGYVFFGDGISRGYVGESPWPYNGDKITNDAAPQSGNLTLYQSPRWLGKSLRLVLDEKREIVGIEQF
ncbi:P-loop containing nucleoside triphosphate hydrolase protein [Dendrothele bispora CBS 962.96]|uniref:P-loop containing nucleoside triphosphate hydrolase protein n=1 Tax=Dendrothele bispora (strain CBS 962.96) TaxID=1314807 RepID=A0A4V4HI42_DENBC|nr:P-loop containing nucleoside triphosphate hydrolase protein [Dendrothele bispora CBS 962.96]